MDNLTLPLTIATLLTALTLKVLIVYSVLRAARCPNTSIKAALTLMGIGKFSKVVAMLEDGYQTHYRPKPIYRLGARLAGPALPDQQPL